MSASTYHGHQRTEIDIRSDASRNDMNPLIHLDDCKKKINRLKIHQPVNKICGLRNESRPRKNTQNDRSSFYVYSFAIGYHRIKESGLLGLQTVGQNAVHDRNLGALFQQPECGLQIFRSGATRKKIRGIFIDTRQHQTRLHGSQQRRRGHHFKHHDRCR